MNILITGGAGYIGSVLRKYLNKKGHNTIIVDLKNGENLFHVYELPNIDAIVHLAAIVGEQACDENPKEAWATNLEGTRHMMNLSIRYKIPLIFASTCSVYGPDTNYKNTKVAAERILTDACILRFGTAFGWSPSMRYNLVINKLVQMAKDEGKITIFGGEQWRPFIHVKDIARTILKCIKDDIRGTYDLACENIQLINLGQRIQKCFPNTTIELTNHIIDKRSYEAKLDNFDTKYSLEYGFREIYKKLRIQPTPKHLKLTPWKWCVSYPDKLKLGHATDIGAFTYINAEYGVDIEDNVQIGSHCSIYSANSENGTHGPVIIEEGAKIGSHSLILPNSHIYKNQKIKAYSIIKGD